MSSLREGDLLKCDMDLHGIAGWLTEWRSGVELEGLGQAFAIMRLRMDFDIRS